MAVSPNTYIELKDLNVSNKTLKYLSNDDNSETVINQDNVFKKIRRAEGIVTGKIGVKLTIPLPEAYKTELVKGWVSDLTLYYLWAAKDRVTPDDIKDGRNMALVQLDDFNKGKFTLGIPSADEETAKKAEGKSVPFVRGDT